MRRFGPSVTIGLMFRARSVQATRPAETDGCFALIRRRPKAAACLALVGLAVRFAYVAEGAPRRLPFTDALWYQLEANFLASGRGFVNPILLAFQHQVRPSAAHPPLYALFLAAGSTLGAKSVLAHQLMGCIAGTVTVIGCGLLGEQLGGDCAGLTAMGLAAVYPGLWIADGGIMSEGLFALCATAVTVAAYHYCRTRSVKAAVVVGATIGLAVLTREAADLLLIVLAVPLVLTGPATAIRPRLVRLAAIVAATGVVVGPWVVRNLVTFDRTVIISSGNGTLLGANCPPAYYDAGIGLWYLSCYAPISLPAHADESVAADDAQRAAITYMRHHLTQVPLVVAARAGRTWELYGPLSDADNNRDDGRPHWAVLLSLWSYFIVAPLAAVGMTLLIRRGKNVLPLIAQIAAVTITAAVVWGSVRFRAPAEPVLAVLAAITLSSALRRRRRPDTE